MYKEQIPFGHGSFVGNIMDDKAFFDMPIRDQARLTGWANGCPVVEELTDPMNLSPGRGPEAMAARYGEVNFWFGHIVREVSSINPDLAHQLKEPVVRLKKEPVGSRYEPESIPSEYFQEMAPLGTLAGYALPRVFVEQLRQSEECNFQERQAKLSEALDIVKVSAEYAQTPMELLAYVGEGFISQGLLDPKEVFKHALSTGWRKEHRGYRMIGQFKQTLAECAPALWEAYSALSAEDKQAQGLV